MKKAFLIAVGLACLASVISCEKKMGDWGDVIRLPVHQVYFDSGAHTEIITTGGKNWWVTGVTFDQQPVNLDSIDPLAQDFTLKQPQFTLTKSHGNQITITMKPNRTGSERVLGIGLEAGDYFDGLTVTQGK